MVAVEIAERIKNCLSITPECSGDSRPAWTELGVAVIFSAAFVGSKDDGASGIAASPPALAATRHSRIKTMAQNIVRRMHSFNSKGSHTTASRSSHAVIVRAKSKEFSFRDTGQISIKQPAYGCYIVACFLSSVRGRELDQEGFRWCLFLNVYLQLLRADQRANDKDLR